MANQKEIKAYLLDTDKAQITEIKIIPKLNSIYEAIGCERIDIISVNGPIKFDIYVDDEGLLKANDFFMVAGYPQPVAGSALVVGLEDDDGNTEDAPMSLALIKKMVKFIPRSRIEEYC